MPSARNFFSTEQQQVVIEAIKTAELGTSGEIRIHLENHTRKEPLLRAEEVFHQIGMDKTELRNGILIYVAVKDHKLAIVGDKGINDIVGNDFWNKEKELMIEHFKQEQYVEGLTLAIELIGEQLREHFPYQSNDVNELPDDLSFNDN